MARQDVRFLLRGQHSPTRLTGRPPAGRNCRGPSPNYRLLTQAGSGVPIVAQPKWSKLPLSSDHVDELKASGISFAVAKARGYRTIEAETLGFQRYQAPITRMPGLLIPMYRPGTDKIPSSHQFKMSEPRKVRGRPLKYETPSGLSNVLDLNPGVKSAAADPSSRLWIVEGIKKADCLLSHGETAVGIAGVWAWRGTNSSGGRTALAAFDDIALNGREVIVCFDSDAAEKAQVRNAMERLVHYLRARGADAKFLIAPPSGEEKQGLTTIW